MDKELLEILACPRCRGPVVLAPGEGSLICGSCRLRYRVEDGIPVMLLSEAERVDE